MDEFLQNEELVAEKRLKAMQKPKKFNIGSECPICDFPNPPRDHVSRHFMEELVEYVEAKMPGQLSCNDCGFK